MLSLPQLTIVALDPDDPDAMAAWHATYHASMTFGRQYATPWMLEEMRAEFRADNPGERALAWSGLDDGRVVSVGSLFLPLKDNLTTAYVEVNTLPSRRRQGHGTRMLAHLTAVARQHGRRVLMAEAAYPYDGPVDGAGHPNVSFLTRHGFRFGLGDVQRVLDLPVDPALLEALAEEAAPFHADYRIRQFSGPVPEDIIESYGRLVGSLITEAPTGELDLEPEVFDPDRIRGDEALLEESGRTKYTTVAIARDGTVAAYSQMVVPKYDPGRVYQWGTLALPAHRGHRLGLATKARNLLWLQQERPDLRRLSTYNAEVNTHMIGVNDRLGFRPVERLGEFQKDLA